MISGEPRARTVPIIIGCDTDPDRESLVGPLPKGRLQWRGMLEGIPALKASVASLRDDAGNAPAFTWLLRADEQVRAHHGSAAWPFEEHREHFEILRATGDELGWHPHFWRHDAALGAWYQEIEDVPWQTQMLEDAHAALARAGLAPTSVRMGWDYHNNATLATLDRLGVKVDFSALPGMRTLHGTPPRRSENLFDWSAAPDRPYRPSRADYQRRARGGEAALGILELPMFVAHDRGWGLAAGAQLARKTRSVAPLWDALRRPSYVINVTARPSLFSPLVAGLQRVLRTPGRTDPVFAAYFHPDELLANRTSLYALPHVRDNLAALVAGIRAEGARAIFQTAGAFAAGWSDTRSTDP